MTPHTPEPWKVGKTTHDVPGVYHDGRNSPIALLGDFDGGQNYRGADANAARIVACVNGCAGLTEDEIKQAVYAFKRLKQLGLQREPGVRPK